MYILKDINLEISKGEFVAIIGQSGSGKSTLMNIIGCLDSPSSGEYFIENKEIGSYSPNEKATLRSKKFGFVFQRYNLIPTLSALENVALPAIYMGSKKQAREARASELLDGLGLEDKKHNFPNTLSGGQQQRVSIARALINGGEIILADEPTGALDSKSGEMVMEILLELHKKGHTVVLITHDSHIANFANRIVEIKDGKIISDETKKDEKFSLKSNEIKSRSGISYIKDGLIEAFKMSLNSVLTHKLRSILTMLGIIIGIASVICVVALGKGSQEQILSSIRAIGTNTITIYPGKSFGDMRANRVNSLFLDDAEFLANQSYLEYSTPNTNTSGTLTYQNQNLNASLRGGGEHSLAINGHEIALGRDFNSQDILESKSLAIIDDTTRKEIFGDKNPLGEVLFFDKKPLTIIGVLKPKDDSFGSELLNIYAPFSTVINKITGDRNIRSITVKVRDEINPQMAEDKLTEVLSAKHGKKDFFTRNSDTIKKTIESTMATMRLLISSIALISLVVGGIGVMNIMLVSVTERTKEIGIRMAIGAKQSSILVQFLIEAIMLCVIGGGLGVMIAYGFGYAFNNLSSSFSMIFSIGPAILALFASSFIGIVFGYLPARNASKLNPIEALLQE